MTSQCRDAAEHSLVPSKGRTPSDPAGTLQRWCAKVLCTLPGWWHEGGHLGYQPGAWPDTGRREMGKAQTFLFQN